MTHFAPSLLRASLSSQPLEVSGTTNLKVTTCAFPSCHPERKKETRQTETPVYRMRSHHGGRVQRPTTIVDRMITWRCHHNFAWRSWSVKSHSPQPSPQPSGKYDRNIAAAPKAKPVDDNSGKNNKTSLPERHPHNKASIKPPPCMNLASRTKLSWTSRYRKLGHGTSVVGATP